MFVASFYSYKGGVGRSVALMNTAHQLAMSGRRVALLDFDLEAPGLQSACSRVRAWNARVKPNSPGFVDLFDEFLTSTEDPPRLERYLSKPFGPGGRIRLMPAGNISDHDRYGHKLWNLNDKLGIDRSFGRELVLYVRDQLSGMKFDYLLVDSRTGHSDVLGATTVLLPHLVIFFTNLSQQSVGGTAAMMDWVRSASDAALNRRRPRQAEKSSLFLRSVDDPAIQMLLVASPIQIGESVVSDQLRNTLGRSFDHVIYHAPRIASDESSQVAVDNAADPVSQYQTLASKIQALNPYEPMSLVRHGIDSLSRQDWRSALCYFDAAEHFLGDEDNESDRILSLRRQYGEVRALALGFQTDKARTLLDRLEAADSVQTQEPDALARLTVERVVANLQMVRGHLASDELDQALTPAEHATAHAERLGCQDEPDALELIARLQLTDVQRFRGDVVGAEDAVKEVPRHARRLNRPIELVVGLQLLATAQNFNCKFEAAAETVADAEREAASLGVGYLQAGCSYTRALIDLAHGPLCLEHLEALERAKNIYEEEGDRLSVANCLNELAIYRHRLRDTSSPTRQTTAVLRDLAVAFERYRDIAGTSLGQVSSLTYAAEVYADCGRLGPIRTREDIGARGIDSTALGVLLRAQEIAEAAKLATAERDILTCAKLLLLFVERSSGDYKFFEREFRSARSQPAAAQPPASEITRKRQQALYDLLTETTAANCDRLVSVADEAAALGLRYEEALAWTHLAVGGVRLGRVDSARDALGRVHAVVNEASFGSSIWGLTYNTRRLCSGDGIEAWRKAADTVLQNASDLGLLESPPWMATMAEPEE